MGRTTLARSVDPPLAGQTTIAALLLALVSTFLFAGLAFAGDPTGAATGGATDMAAKIAGKPTTTELAAELGHVKTSLNLFFVIFGGALVFFMQAGFAIVETGFCRSKNAVHVIMTNFVIFAIGMIAYWAVGFGLMFGGVGTLATLGAHAAAHGLTQIADGWGIFGHQGFFLTGQSYDVVILGFFFFQMVFMDTAATIPTGAMAERWKFSSFVVYGFFIAAIVYPIFGNWVWGGGWLAPSAATSASATAPSTSPDRASSTRSAGSPPSPEPSCSAPASASSPRTASRRVILAHNLPLAILGVIILVFGWIGFNGASTLAATDMRFSVVIVNTFIASAAGLPRGDVPGVEEVRQARPSMAANGMLAGLVAITAPCAFVDTVGAFVIGLIAGFVVVGAIVFVEGKLKVDDPVGAVSVHGICGLWGILAVGLFADGSYGDGWNGVAGHRDRPALRRRLRPARRADHHRRRRRRLGVRDHVRVLQGPGQAAGHPRVAGRGDHRPRRTRDGRRGLPRLPAPVRSQT